MFLQSRRRLAIGEVITGISDHHRTLRPEAVGVVMREATKEEWWQQVADKGVMPSPYDNAFFYYVSFD